MAVPAADGAWLTATHVVRIDCTKCGVVSTSKYNMIERDIDHAITLHVLEHHNGRAR